MTAKTDSVEKLDRTQPPPGFAAEHFDGREGWAEILTWPETELAREEGELAALEEVVRA